MTGISGLPEFEPNDDIADPVERETTVRDGDVLVVASTIISKVEGRTADLAAFPPSESAKQIAATLEEAMSEQRDLRFVQAVIKASDELLLETPFVLAVTPFGHISVNAGIDRSNVPDANLLLLRQPVGKRGSHPRTPVRRRGARHHRQPALAVPPRPARGHPRLGGHTRRIGTGVASTTASAGNSARRSSRSSTSWRAQGTSSPARAAGAARATCL